MHEEPLPADEPPPIHSTPAPESVPPPPEVEARPYDPVRERGPTYDAKPAGGEAGAARAKEKSTLWPVMCHLSPLLQCLFWVPGVNVLAPLIVWQANKDDPDAVHHGREAVNFQLTLLGASLLLLASCILSPLLPVVWIAGIVLSVVAAFAASERRPYRYPFTVRLLRS